MPTITKEDRIIAEFMEVTVHDNMSDYLISVYRQFRKEGVIRSSHKLTQDDRKKRKEIENSNTCEPKYRTSWNWIFRVYKKIILLKTSGKMTSVNLIALQNTILTGNISLTYKALVAIIRIYNINNKRYAAIKASKKAQIS